MSCVVQPPRAAWPMISAHAQCKFREHTLIHGCGLEADHVKLGNRTGIGAQLSRAGPPVCKNSYILRSTIT